MRHITGPLTLAAATVVLGATGVAWVTADPSDRAQAKNYRGELLTAGGGKVALRVKHRGGAPRAVRFSLRDVLGSCDDGSNGQTDFGVVRPRFLNRREFRHESYFREDTYVEYYRVRGTLEGKRSARGDVLFFHDPDDPPGTTNLPECHIRGDWRARAPKP